MGGTILINVHPCRLALSLRGASTRLARISSLRASASTGLGSRRPAAARTAHAQGRAYGQAFQMAVARVVLEQRPHACVHSWWLARPEQLQRARP